MIMQVKQITSSSNLAARFRKEIAKNDMSNQPGLLGLGLIFFIFKIDHSLLHVRKE